MMRLAILNPLISRTPKSGCESIEKWQFSECDFFRKIHFCRIWAELLHARNIRKTTNHHLKLIISIPFEHYWALFVIFFNILMISTGFHRLFPFSRVFWACNNFARRLKNKKIFSKKVANFRCSWYQWIPNCHFLYVNSHFLENGR
jgi:hypothetical protein